MTPAILICAHKQENGDLLQSFLRRNGYLQTDVVKDVISAQRMLSLKTYALILVDIPFTSDVHELSFLLSLNEADEAFVMAMVSRQQYDIVRNKTEKFGIFTIVKPIQKEFFTQVLGIGSAWFYRNHHIRKKQEQLLDKIKEIKLVDRAKCLLIEHEYMSEEEAHKRIEKSAMNERVNRKTIARRIIAQYEE